MQVHLAAPRPTLRKLGCALCLPTADQPRVQTRGSERWAGLTETGTCLCNLLSRCVVAG